MGQYEISLQNRMPMGIALGWSYYPPNAELEYSEVCIYLFLVSIIIRWI